MMDLLELVLSFLLEVLSDIPWPEYCWRLFLPIALAYGLVLLIHWTISSEIVQLILGIPTSVGGIITGVIWHFRKA